MSEIPAAIQPAGGGQAKFNLNTLETPFTGTAEAYKDRCFTFLNVLCNDKDMEKSAAYLAPNCILVHEDHPPMNGPEAFIGVWKKNLAVMPHYHKDIKDIIVEMLPEDHGGARVWVYSQIQGITEGATTDSIDMMRFTPEGFFLSSKDVQRTIKPA